MKKETASLEFLQSPAWMDFQAAFGRKTFLITQDAFRASLAVHELPLVGRYLYCPRGPVASLEGEELSKIKNGIHEMIRVARNNNAGWIRIEPKNEQLLEYIRRGVSEKIVKAPYDVQPKEIFAVDISKSEGELLSDMKPKTRYNINLARKKKVVIKKISHKNENQNDEYVKIFLQLTKEMAHRNGISAHPDRYYQKMIELLPPDMLAMYTAQYDGETIAAHLMVFYGTVATYLHGASANKHRNVMAPFLLQWEAIVDARARGCTVYDFGGIKLAHADHGGQMVKNDWQGITNFKLGFSPSTKPTIFPGTYDIIINPRAYMLYRGLQRAKMMVSRLKK